MQNQGAAQWECIVDLTQALGLSKEIVFFFNAYSSGYRRIFTIPVWPQGLTFGWVKKDQKGAAFWAPGKTHPNIPI